MEVHLHCMEDVLLCFWDYLYTYHMQTYLDCLFLFHLDPLIRRWLLSLYHYIAIPVILYVTFGLHFTTQIHRTASFPISLLHTPKPMYNMIWQLLRVRYDLVD